MNQATERSGNVYQTRDQLAQVASELLGTHEIDTELRNLLEAQKLASETVPFSNGDTALYIPSMLAAERGLSKRILALIEAPQGKEPSPQWLERTLAKKKSGSHARAARRRANRSHIARTCAHRRPRKLARLTPQKRSSRP